MFLFLSLMMIAFGVSLAICPGDVLRRPRFTRFAVVRWLNANAIAAFGVHGVLRLAGLFVMPFAALIYLVAALNNNAPTLIWAGIRLAGDLYDRGSALIDSGEDEVPPEAI